MRAACPRRRAREGNPRGLLAFAVHPKTATFHRLDEVLEVVGRLQLRIADALVTDSTAREPISIAGIGAFRGHLAALAQSTLDAGLASWAGAKDYEARLLITSF